MISTEYLECILKYKKFAGKQQVTITKYSHDLVRIKSTVTTFVASTCLSTSYSRYCHLIFYPLERQTNWELCWSDGAICYGSNVLHIHDAVKGRDFQRYCCVSTGNPLPKFQFSMLLYRIRPNNLQGLPQCL
jgi:hypothetical protein